MNWILNLANGLRVALWRFVLARRGGRVGRGCKMDKGVRLDCRPGHPILLADGVRLMRGVVLVTVPSGRIVLEENVYVGEYGVLASRAGIHIQRDTIIAPHANVVDFDYLSGDPSAAEPPTDASPIHIGRDVWIGAGVKILRGVHIGDQAVIGAGAVVDGDVPDRGVAVGVPAHVIRFRGKPATQRAGKPRDKGNPNP